MKVFSNSRWKTARSCMRQHHYRYTIGMTSVLEAKALRFGSLIHLGLEARWRNLLEGAYEAMLLALEQEADPYDRARARALLHGYHYRWEADFADYEVLAVESEFRVPLVNPRTGARSRTWQQGGKFDVLVRSRRDGMVRVVEHKTSSEDIGNGDYWARLRLDSQVSGYMDAANAMGLDVVSTLYDVIAKPGLRPKMATPVASRKYTKGKRCKTCRKEERQCIPCFVEEPSRLYSDQRELDESPGDFEARLCEDIAAHPEQYYQRGDVVRLEHDVNEHRHDLWQWSRQVADSERTGVAPRNTSSCSQWNRSCEFLAVCAGEASIDDPMRFRKRETNPELETTNG